jgi:hypothetical protein
LRFLTRVDCDSFPLLSSSSIATYMMGVFMWEDIGSKPVSVLGVLR